MRYIKILFILLFAICLSGSYYPEIAGDYILSAENSGFSDGISAETKKMLEKIGIEGLDPEALSSVSFEEIWNIITDCIIEKIKEPFESVVSVTVCSIICAAASSFYGDFKISEKVLSAVSALTAAAVFIVPIKNLMFSSAGVIGECSDFMLGFIPVYSSAVAASGYVSSAAGFHSLMLAAVTVISDIADEIIVPLIGIYLGICVSASVSELDISGISKSVKNFALWILGISMTVFSGIMGLGTLAASSADDAFSKTAKFVIGSAVPVVGSTVSEAFSAVKSCLHITKNFLGIYGVFAIAMIFIPSIISLFLWKTSLSVSSGISSVSGNKKLSELLYAASSVTGIMLALVILTAVLFIFAVFIMLMAGGS